MTCPVCVDADGADVSGAEIDAANAGVLADVDDGAVDSAVLAAGNSAASFVSISAYEADMVRELWPEAGRRTCPDGADADLVAGDGAETDAANVDVLADVDDGAASISIDLLGDGQ